MNDLSDDYIYGYIDNYFRQPIPHYKVSAWIHKCFHFFNRQDFEKWMLEPVIWIGIDLEGWGRVQRETQMRCMELYQEHQQGSWTPDGFIKYNPPKPTLDPQWLHCHNSHMPGDTTDPQFVPEIQIGDILL